MATVQSQPEVGSLLRQWRERRRVTQFELALDAGVSARHLSFVETGRSKPGREMLLGVLEQLKVPFREQNDGRDAAELGQGSLVNSPPRTRNQGEAG